MIAFRLICVLLIVISLSSASFAAWTLSDVAADVVFTWNPGRSGGIPSYTLGATTAADNTGASDATATIEAELALLSPGEYLYLPAGTYRLDSELDIDESSIELRGSGTGTILLVNHNDATGIRLANSGSIGADLAVAEDVDKGEADIDLDDASSLSAGDYVLLSQTDDADVEVGGSWCNFTIGAVERNIYQMSKITNKVGNTITISPTPYRAYDDAAHAVMINKVNIGVTNSGVKNLKIDHNGLAANDIGSYILMSYAASCWIYGVEGDETPDYHVKIVACYQCNVRHNYFHHALTYDDGGNGYGIDLSNGTSECLIDDNITYHLRHHYVVEGSGPGNVIAYNYGEVSYGDHDAAQKAFVQGCLITHNAHPEANLFEGNMLDNIRHDNAHGSSQRNVSFRNRLDGKSDSEDATVQNQAQVGYDAQDENEDLVAVGNVIFALGDVDDGIIQCADACDKDDNLIGIKLGWDNDGCLAPCDTDVEDSFYNHQNVIFYAANQPGITDEGDSADLPDSLYLTDKPSWWFDQGRCRPWPAIGPDVSGYVIDIPAKDRFEGEFESCTAEGVSFQ